MRGVRAKIHNGTVGAYFADDMVDVHFHNDTANYTYNATMSIEGNFILAGGLYLNNIFIQFLADDDYTGNTNRHFHAQVGIRPFNKTLEEKKDDLIIPDAIIHTPPFLKHVTFSEWILIITFLFGIATYCIKKTYCTKLDNWLATACCVKREKEEKNKKRDRLGLV